MIKIINAIRLFFRKLFKIDRWTTHDEFRNRHKYDSKKKLIKSIINVAGLINKSPAIVDPEYYQELRDRGKKALLKTLCLLQIAYTKKMKGGKDA